jgi:DNA-binding response OmpR family regulator
VTEFQDIKKKFTFNFRNASVAMIDASPLSLEVMTNMFAGFGFRKMYRCSTLALGTEVIKTRAIDLLLIDPTGFGQDGYDLISFMRSDKRGINSDTPIILVCGHTPLSQITAMRRSGADYLIAKPFSTAGLLERILWVAASEGRRGELVGPQELVTTEGSGLEMW